MRRWSSALEFKYFKAFTPEQAYMCRDALRALDPGAFRQWPGFLEMVERLQSKRPVLSVSAPDPNSLRILSSHKSQPCYGLSDQLRSICSVIHEGENVYASDEMTDQKWADFQDLMTFWGVIIKPCPL